MLQTFQPRSILLQPYIDFFYVFNVEKPENISYIAFPHVNTAVSFFKNANIKRGNFAVNIEAIEGDITNCVVEILGKYIQPVFVNYTGHCEEVAIVFKPLGANHFFNDDLINIAPMFSQSLENENWIAFSHDLFKEKSIESKMMLLENFLLQHLKKSEDNWLYDALEKLEDPDTNDSIDTVAKDCGFTMKTFQRHFKKHLTCSPVEYKRIARFRHSLRNKLISKELKTLTELAYTVNYYDQSYFIREFKKLTQLNPKSFFETINTSHEKNIVWKLK